MTTTCIRNADWVVRWNPDEDRHEYLRGADVVFRDDAFIHVGPGYAGAVDEEIDGLSLMAMPGLVNIHCHPTNQPITRAIREEIANPSLYMTALYDRTGLWRADQEALLSGAAIAYGELLKSGVTSVVDYAAAVPDGWVDQMAQSGLRIFAAPSYRDASWSVHNESRLDYSWSPDDGQRQFDAALALVDQTTEHACGRLTGMIAPGQVDTCTEDTFARSLAAAKQRGLVLQTHAAQSLPEFHEMTRRTGKTPIQWLGDIGVLGPGTIVAHGIFTDEHSWTRWHSRDDLALLAETGTTVAHCPVVFSRYGHKLESFGKYQRAGINMGIGTDTAPHNLLEEMREAIILSRIAAGRVDDATARDVFNAVTVNGARALGRTDIGRLGVGAKADMVLVDLGHPLMRPGRDPLRNLIFTAADRAVKHVYVDGEKLVADGKVLSLDCGAATEKLEAAQARAEMNVATLDAEGRDGAEISPPVLPMAD
ncbi:MAG: amidohydrolase family protein [Rhodospirillaceae bacterium]|jgi:5-methylthioadenosine/S-adenosylhomocysteine deaminase|nr:amidohydrolase family protein [Rhodospirillaceae bacterium]MBT5459642.1 amidohydrolase family protein [Rhodospirillaceae bacterium]